MKKIIYSILSLTLMVSLFSCTEEAEVWDSSTKDFAGNWSVVYDHSSYGSDPWGQGHLPLRTFNTASDNGTEIWVEDADFWGFQVRIPVNADGVTFGSADTVYSIVEDYEIKVIVNNGRIVQDAVKLPSGVMADSIYLEVWLEDLYEDTGSTTDTLLVSGFRVSGFPEDVPH